VWQQAFKNPIDWGNIEKSASVLISYSIGFWLVTLFVFRRKDILS